MSNNLIKRLITSIILLIILFFVNFSHEYIFILSLLILGVLICNEFSKIFKNLVGYNFLILNTIAFLYIFFVFGRLSYEVYILKNPTFFLFILSVCIFSDIGGYVFGKTLGGKKLTKISPNKTVFGLIGSFILSVIPILIFSNLNNIELDINLKSIIFCLLISLVNQLGDLFISYLKRKAHIKDTGKILPGHGGLLDRMDGIIFAVPFSYYLIKII